MRICCYLLRSVRLGLRVVLLLRLATLVPPIMTRSVLLLVRTWLIVVAYVDLLWMLSISVGRLALRVAVLSVVALRLSS